MPTLSALRAVVADYLGHPTPSEGETSVRLTLARVDRAINDGYVRFARESRCFRREAILDAVDGQAVYLLPADLWQPLQVRYGGHPTPSTTAELLDRLDGDWRDWAPNPPQYWLREGARSLRLAPPPLVSTGTELRVLGEITPSDVEGGIPLLVEDEDEPQLPFAFQSAPALWAVSDLAQHYLAGDTPAMASGQLALAEYRLLLRDFLASLVVEGAYG